MDAPPSSAGDWSGFLIPANEDEVLQEILISGGGDGASGERNEILQTQIGHLLGGIDFGEDGRQVLLLRPSKEQPGFMAYYQDQDGGGKRPNKQNSSNNNKRATCFAMTCGLLNARFVGDVVVLKVMPIIQKRNPGECPLLSMEQLLAACTTPDVRPDILVKLVGSLSSSPSSSSPPLQEVPQVIEDAVSNNYNDRAVLKKFQDVMKTRASFVSEDEISGDFVSFVDSEGDAFDIDDDADEDDDDDDVEGASRSSDADGVQFTVTRVPLCLHCRRPASTLCEQCEATYFCDAPRKCREEGWSHDCLCPTWNIYTQRRSALSSFPLGPWTKNTVTRQCELSDEPYEQFLNKLGIQRDDKSWWKAEFGGWLGGSSESAKLVNLDEAYSYSQGFAPITDIPAQQDIHIDELKTNNWDDELGLRRLSDWREYYELRGIPLTSPVSLLLTFPLTLYYAIVEYGMAPCKVARMMGRPLRIDVVGVEKELHFLPLFQEVVFLLPDDLHLELVFVVRPDMLPESMRASDSKEHTIKFGEKLQIRVLSGTYGYSLDPLFDCGRSGSPDMVVAFNAGLYAYESWRSVVEFLQRNKSAIGVFTDYNEWSGVQCASLGGGESRKSLTINPFRQPRAMPVYSMNLPQFSNGFIYVFNQQSMQD
ncbi:hypothetical protein ACA910_010315 [Epithemia clementina (nom. ined.)]